MPEASTTTWWLFPPRTTEVQFDEKWAFVAKKEAQCDRSDPDDDHKGDYWDHVAYDPVHRMVLNVIPGARTIENTELLVEDFHRRTEGRLMDLMTSDDYPAYETAILHTYGATVTPPRTGRPGRPKGSYQTPPAGLTYAVVEKTRAKGRVVRVGSRVVFGGDLFHDGLVQLLLGGAHADDPGQGRPSATAKPSDVGGFHRSCVVDGRMAIYARRATMIGHEG